MNREYLVLFEPDEGGWTASVPDLPGCFSDADTLDRADTLIREAIGLWIETAESNGWPVPEARTSAKRIAV